MIHNQEKVVVFVAEKRGTSQKGNPYQVITLAQLISKVDKDGVVKVVTRVSDYLTPEPIKLPEGIMFGDIVDCDWQDSDFDGGTPRLVGLDLTGCNPYVSDEGF